MNTLQDRTHLLTGEDDAPEAKPGKISTEQKLPKAFAPLVRNVWYVISARNELTHALRGIKVLGELLVMYRAENGEPVVLDDRCAHRRFLLSKSHLEGDTIRCGYHGFTFDKTGQCIFAPGVDTKMNVKVRRYPAAEKGPWLWVWMGDPAKAKESDIPWPDEDETWDGVYGYTYNKANYMLMIENLLDVTHLHYMHGPHVADLAYVSIPPDNVPLEKGVGWRKEVARTAVASFAPWVGSDPDRLVRQVDNVQVSGPSLAIATQDRTPIDGDTAPVVPRRNRIAHALTPDSLYGTHQFWSIEFTDPIVMPKAIIIEMVQKHVFSQDVEAVATMHEVIMQDHRAGIVEANLVNDRWGIKMRRVIAELARAET